MTDTELDPELEVLLRDCLRAVADATPVLDPDRRTHRARATIALVAASLVVLGTAGVAFVVGRGVDMATSEPTTTAAVEADPILLGPTPGFADLQVTSTTRALTFAARHGGAVRTASGDIIGLAVYPNPDALPSGDSRQIGGYRVVLAPFEETGYRIEDGCVMAAITTSSGVGRWGSDLIAFVDELSIDDGRVVVDLPEGWRSLGSGLLSEVFTISVWANLSSDVDYNFRVTQRPHTSIGVFFADPGSESPLPITLFGEPAWFFSDDGGVEQSLVFQDGPTAVRIGGKYVSEDQLRWVAANLTEQPWSVSTAMGPAAPAPEPTLASETTEPAANANDACPISLEIVESD